MITIIWLLLTKIFFRVPGHISVDPAVVKREYHELGPMSFEERVVLAAFILTALGWVFRQKIDIGLFSIPGWSQWLPFPELIDDGTVALTVALVLFLIPSRSREAPSGTIMSTQIVKELPWDIVLLFGGGFALAKGFQETGLTMVIGNNFAALAGVPPFIMTVMICFFLTFLTELTSNTATTEMLLPILASVAIAMKANPLLLMIPATLSASCAFMMPVATPPNAIIFGAGRVKISEMARVGICINLIGVVVIAVLFYLIGTAIFSIDPATFPDWARV